MDACILDDRVGVVEMKRRPERGKAIPFVDAQKHSDASQQHEQGEEDNAFHDRGGFLFDDGFFPLSRLPMFDARVVHWQRMTVEAVVPPRVGVEPLGWL